MTRDSGARLKAVKFVATETREFGAKINVKSNAKCIVCDSVKGNDSKDVKSSVKSIVSNARDSMKVKSIWVEYRKK